MIGQMNKLRVLKEVSFGVYLDGQTLGEILLPSRYIPQGVQVGDEVEVFLYHDSEDRVIATTEVPYAQVNQCAYLKCIATNRAGAFLNWGLSKDLLVPFNQQKPPMEEGRSYVVYLYQDEQSGRMTASAKLDRFLFQDSDEDFEAGEKVELLNAAKTDLGYKVIINHTHWGLLHHQEASRYIKRGERFTGYIKQIRDDGKIDVCLHQHVKDKMDENALHILSCLRQAGGFLPYHDKSQPEDIQREFGMSKGLFKKSIGKLYKEKRIDIQADGIQLKSVWSASHD